MKKYLLIYNAHLIDKNFEKKNSAILVEEKKIVGFPTKEAVKALLADTKNKVTCFDAKGAVVMPAFIDTHAHFRDPGLTQKEDLESGSWAAAQGGYGTVVLMPNTNPVVSSESLALHNNEVAEKLGAVKVIQSVSITKDFDGKTISHLEKINSKKIPLITEDGKEVADSAVMFKAMKLAAKNKLIVSCHCEDPALASEAKVYRTNALNALKKKNKTEAKKNLEKANELLALAEDTATSRNIRLAEDAGCRLHLCHVSTARCVEEVKASRARGNTKLTFEVTPHHLGLSSEKENIFQIVNPPLRSESDRQVLVKALLDGTATCIGTDHAPHTAQDKENGAPGFSGIETSFAVCNSVLVKENGMSLKKLSELMSANAAELLGLTDRGLLEEGMTADLAVVDPDAVWTVRGEEFASKGKYTPLEGKKLSGKVLATVHEGKVVFLRGEVLNQYKDAEEE